MYKDKNLEKTPTARKLMDIIVESREWKDRDFCSFPLGKSIITLSKCIWNHHLLYNEDYHLQEYDKRKGTFIIDKYYSSPEAAFLDLLQTYDEIGYHALKGYIEEEKENTIPTYKDLDKIQTAKYPAEIIRKAETWAYGDSCILLFGDDKYTLTKILDNYWSYRLANESECMYYDSPRDALLALLRNYDRPGYRMLEEYLETGKTHKRSDFYGVESLLKDVRELHNNTPSGIIHDADTVFADIMEENCKDGGDVYKESGIAEDIFSIWEKSTDKVSVEKMFAFFTGMEFETFLKKCIEEITRNPADLDHKESEEEQEEER